MLRAFRTAIPEMVSNICSQLLRWCCGYPCQTCGSGPSKRACHTVGMAKQNRNRQQMTELPRIRHVTVLAMTLDEWAGKGY